MASGDSSSGGNLAKQIHEIRDPIHSFVRVSTRERSVVDSAALQRLRGIHQLAMTYLVYPSATHCRFEHSLGVLELAGRVFDVLIQPNKMHPRLEDDIKSFLFDEKLTTERAYWRSVLRMGALCHDVGHAPFSHAGEDLYPSDWGDHERMSEEIILSDFMARYWEGDEKGNSGGIPYAPKNIVDLAVKPDKQDGQGGEQVVISPLMAVLGEIVTGDAFGVDRIDYLLRDSYHLGVAYGNFDLPRLLDTLVVLPFPDDLEPGGSSGEPSVGIELGGLQAAEALAIARYSMFSQVYFHHIRRIFDIHYKEFLKDYLPDGYFPIDPHEHLKLTDAEIVVAMREAASDRAAKGHEAASRIVDRKHYRLVWKNQDGNARERVRQAHLVRGAVVGQFGTENFRFDSPKKGMGVNFRVRLDDDQIVAAGSYSNLIANIPELVAMEYIFVEPSIHGKVGNWLKSNLPDILDQEMANIVEMGEEMD